MEIKSNSWNCEIVLIIVFTVKNVGNGQSLSRVSAWLIRNAQHWCLLLPEFEVHFVCYGPSYFPADWIYGPSAKFVSHKSGLEKTRFVRYLSHLWVHIDEKGFNSNKLLNLAGGTVKYGPLNWPIIALVLNKRHNKVYYIKKCNTFYLSWFGFIWSHLFTHK